MTENQYLLDAFSCGNSGLDDTFRTSCADDETAVTKIVINNDNNDVICVYSLNCASMILENYGKHYPAPSVEIKYFAVNSKYQDLKAIDEDDGCLSNVIFYDVMRHIFDFTDDICGANFVLLYSTPEGESFYRKCGFIDFPLEVWRNDSRYLDGCVPLYFRLR